MTLSGIITACIILGSLFWILPGDDRSGDHQVTL